MCFHIKLMPIYIIVLPYSFYGNNRWKAIAFIIVKLVITSCSNLKQN